MFKKFVQRIVNAKDQADAWDTVFNAEDGIDIAFQRGKITWNEHQLLFALIKKMA